MIVSPAPSVWPFVARALGFEVLALCTSDVAFRSLVGSIHKQAIGSWQATDVQVVFGDWEGLLGMPNEHWREHRVPHVGTLVEGERKAGHKTGLAR